MRKLLFFTVFVVIMTSPTFMFQHLQAPSGGILAALEDSAHALLDHVTSWW